MRLLDADILAYALYDESPAHEESWTYIENHVQHGNPLHLTSTTILEVYNTLFWYYKVRPLTDLIQKISLTLDMLEPVPTSLGGLHISETENIPLGDGFLIDTARKQRIPIIVSNDQHIAKTAPRYGCIVENPITDKVRSNLSEYKP